MKLIKIIIFEFLILNICGCSFTVYNWKEIPEQNNILKLSDTERVQEYKKYAIKKVYQSYSNGFVFSTYLEPNVAFKFDSYTPIINSITPDYEEYFNKAIVYRNYRATQAVVETILYPSLFVATSLFFKNKQDNLINAGMNPVAAQTLTKEDLSVIVLVFLGTILGGLFLNNYFESLELEQYNLLIEKFNTDLANKFEVNLNLMKNIE